MTYIGKLALDLLNIGLASTQVVYTLSKTSQVDDGYTDNVITPWYRQDTCTMSTHLAFLSSTNYLGQRQSDIQLTG